MTKLNKDAYERLVQEDIDALNRMYDAYKQLHPDGQVKLEKEHIEVVLRNSIRSEYEK